MKDYNFSIKVSDILRNPSTRDTIYFEKKFSTHIPHLTDEGIEAEIFLQGLSHDQLSCTITSCSCSLVIECDACGDTFQKKISIGPLTKRLSLSSLNEEDEDDVTIDKKTETIDLEYFLSSLLLLSNDVVNKCTSCQKSTSTEDDEITETSNIIWK